MLRVEQAAELLRRCEKITGVVLTQIRGHLKKPDKRAAALFELLVIEASATIGAVEYEPLPGGSPDIKIKPLESRHFWIEVAFLYPRFWKEEHVSRVISSWLWQEAEKRGIPPYKISPQFNGIDKKGAGPVRKLPALNERKQFLSSDEIKKFFYKIARSTSNQHIYSSKRYTISVKYSPNERGPYLSSGGLSQEVPKNVKEHAVYRVLKKKAKQHNVNGPRIVCIGSDQSDALSKMNRPISLESAIDAVFYNNHALSAVIIIKIEDSPVTFGVHEKHARGELFINPYARSPLNPDEIEAIKKLNFNKWKYSWSLPKQKYRGKDHYHKVGGTLTWSPGPYFMKIEIPANIIVDALAGKTTIDKEFDLKKDNPIYKAINEGWKVESCSYKPGNIERAEGPKLILELSCLDNVFENKKSK